MSDCTYLQYPFNWLKLSSAQFFCIYPSLVDGSYQRWPVANEMLVYKFRPAYMWLLCLLPVFEWSTGWVANQIGDGWKDALAHNWLVNLYYYEQIDRSEEWTSEAGWTLRMRNARYVVWRLFPGNGCFLVIFSSSSLLIRYKRSKLESVSAEKARAFKNSKHTRLFDIWTEGNLAYSKGKTSTT